MPYTGDNLMDVKRTNRSAALRSLHEQGAMSRKRLAEQIRLTPAAITKIVGEMLDEGLVQEGQALPSGSAGRREVLVELKPQARCALGLLLNRGQAILSAVWMDGEVIFSEEHSLPRPAPTDETVTRLCARLLALAREHGLDDNKLLGVGVAVRGVTAPDARTVRNSFGALDEANCPLAALVEARTGLPTVMANNVRALFAAQMFLSRDRELRSQFFLRCEYGIGGSLSIDRRIWRGGTEQCAEIGHIPVVRRGGKPCSCGKSGCLETIASPAALREDALALLKAGEAPVLANLLKEQPPESLTVGQVLDAARNGDAAVAALVDRAVSSLAMALKSVIYVIDPEKIVLYGGLFENSYYLARLMTELREGVDAGHNVAVEKSRYNERLEPCAAALLVVQDYLDRGGM